MEDVVLLGDDERLVGRVVDPFWFVANEVPPTSGFGFARTIEYFNVTVSYWRPSRSAIGPSVLYVSIHVSVQLIGTVTCTDHSM